MVYFYDYEAIYYVIKSSRDNFIACALGTFGLLEARTCVGLLIVHLTQLSDFVHTGIQLYYVNNFHSFNSIIHDLVECLRSLLALYKLELLYLVI